MRIIKKQSDIALDSLNLCLKDTSCMGVSLPAKYSLAGNLTINGTDAIHLITHLDGANSVLNFHLFNQKKLSPSDYRKIAGLLSRVKASSFILSSSQLARETLNELRDRILDFENDNSLTLVVAAESGKGLRSSDMIYSCPTFDKNKLDQVAGHINDGIPVLVDWPDNNNQRISDLIEKTNNSEGLILLSEKPHTTRRIRKETMRKYHL